MTFSFPLKQSRCHIPSLEQFEPICDIGHVDHLVIIPKRISVRRYRGSSSLRDRSYKLHMTGPHTTRLRRDDGGNISLCVDQYFWVWPSRYRRYRSRNAYHANSRMRHFFGSECHDHFGQVDTERHVYYWKHLCTRKNPRSTNIARRLLGLLPIRIWRSSNRLFSEDT